MAEAITEPIAIVIAKSKLDIFENDLTPYIRVKSISEMYIPKDEITTINIAVLVVSSQDKSMI